MSAKDKLRLTVSEWAKAKKTPFVWVRAASIAFGWPNLYVLLSESDYDDAIKSVTTVECH